LFSQSEPRRTESPKASGRERAARRWLTDSDMMAMIKELEDLCQERGFGEVFPSLRSLHLTTRNAASEQ